MNIDRSKTSFKSLSSIEDDEFVDASPADRFMMVWPLTREIWNSYKPGYADRPLQRNVTTLRKL